MPKYTVEDLDPRNWENQIEKDIVEDCGDESFAIEWTDPTKQLFAGEIQIEQNTRHSRNNSNYLFERDWNEKMRQQKKK